MSKHRLSPVHLGLLLAGLATTMPTWAESYFQRIASFHVESNRPANQDAKKPTSAEIIQFAKNGQWLVYSDSPGQALGLVNIVNPRAPLPGGVVALGGEPTSVVVQGDLALVGVVTSKDKTQPDGHLATVDIQSQKVVAQCPLNGQPDSLALSPDGQFLAIAIENERDEDLRKGQLPQLPGGNLTIFNMSAQGVDCNTRRVVDLTGLALVAPEDPEPEFVDVNRRNEAVVTLQENNHVVIVDLATAKVVRHFSAGQVTQSGVDTERDGVLAMTGQLAQVPREPDAVRWLDDERFVTADEGDYKGGSRSYTVFDKTGQVLFGDQGWVEQQSVRLGHFPEKRANKKGSEPEGLDVGVFDGKSLIFVGTERASLVHVLEDRPGQAPRFMQSLPGGVGPEGIKTHAGRQLLVTASEVDGRKDGAVGSVISLYEYGYSQPSYPHLVSVNDAKGQPIGWGALSGLAAAPRKPGHLFAVTDSFYSQASILKVDATTQPARITQALTVHENGAPAKGLDLEGIAVAKDGGFWLASEGNPEKGSSSTLIKANAKGQIIQKIALPDELKQHETRFGFEGVTVGQLNGQEVIWLAVQREWKNDPKGLVKLLAYTPATGQWKQLHYPLSSVANGWTGLSEVTATAQGLYLIERDNLVGPQAAVKWVTFVAQEQLRPVAIGVASVPVVRKQIVRDLMPAMRQFNGYTLDKVEGFAIDAQGQAFVVTDNDGVDNTSGETLFLRLGALPR